MPTTNFVDGQTVISADWLNEVDEAVFNPASISLPATSVTNTPAGNIAAVTVQAALNELDSEKQPLDNELTALATATAAANKIPYFTGTTTADTLTWNSASALANSATTISSNTVIKTAIDAMDIETQVAPSTAGNVLTSAGGVWTSAAPVSCGVGQTWQNMTGVGGRATGVTMTNSSGKPIMLSISGSGTAALSITIDGAVVYNLASLGAGSYPTATIIVPNGSTYIVTCSAISTWYELR